MARKKATHSILGLALLTLSACATTDGRLAKELRHWERPLGQGHGALLQPLLSEYLSKDSYLCKPRPERVLRAPETPAPMRIIRGTMPHYSFFRGPYRYRVRSEQTATGQQRWLVEMNVALTAAMRPTMTLPDCQLQGQGQRCQGTPNEQAPGRHACPSAGSFSAAGTQSNVRTLLRQWSTRIEADYNRDAKALGLSIRYDFEFFLAEDAKAVRGPVDWRLPLHLNCSRQPYFQGLRSGWSRAILAHEIGHFLGLIDEYYALSGITPLFPKTPFLGAEKSRMGLSMKRNTRFFSLHHYLILRRYHCPSPARRDPFPHKAPI